MSQEPTELTVDTGLAKAMELTIPNLLDAVLALDQHGLLVTEPVQAVLDAAMRLADKLAPITMFEQGELVNAVAAYRKDRQFTGGEATQPESQ